MTILLFTVSVLVTFVCVTILWTIIGANFVNRNYETAALHGLVLGAVVAILAPLLIALVTQSWEVTVTYSTIVTLVSAVPVGALALFIAFSRIVR